jgi:N-methylhydantoinase A
MPTSIYQRGRLPGGVPFEGPAIVEEMGATTIIPSGWAAAVGVWGEIMLNRRSV